MIYGIGIDLTEKKRIRKLLINHSSRFVERILTCEEQLIYQSFQSFEKKIEFLGGRFSAKESYSKALGTGFNGLSFQDLAILNHTNGNPYFLYHPYKGKSYVSITHTDELVMTEVILVEKNEI